MISNQPETGDSKMSEPIPWTTEELLYATRGKLISGDKTRFFKGVSIDSRRISKEDLFVAIKGQVHDGHSYVRDAAALGVGGFIVEKRDAVINWINTLEKSPPVCIVVEDTEKALKDLSVFQRERSRVSLIAITGSNGKTSTKDMTARVLEQQFKTLSTTGNLNNEIGVPLTLLKLSRRHEWAVLELGMNNPGEIGRLTHICKPDIGIITNIGPAHLEGLGSLEGVMHAKGELIDNMRPDATAILNADDPLVLRLAEKKGERVLLFGVSANADIRASKISLLGSRVSFLLELPNGSIDICLNNPGRFMVSNALAAAGAGYFIGLSPEKIKQGLESFQPIRGRMNVIDTPKGIHIIDDTYNANPVSMEAAIHTLASLKSKNRGILVAGDMFELGKDSEIQHAGIGELAGKTKTEKIYATGKYARDIQKGALAEGMNANDIFIGSKEEIVEDLKKNAISGDWILVKGSRAMGMETIVQRLKEWSNDL